MVLLLSIMFAITVLSFLKAQRTDDELKVMAKHVIPLSNLIAKIDINSLEQEIILERVLRNYETEQLDMISIERDLDKFENWARRLIRKLMKDNDYLNPALKRST